MEASVIVTVGDLIDDIVVRTREPFRPATDTAAEISRHRGGSAANVAALVAHCGHPARFVGYVGADPVADRLVGELNADGVETAVERGGHTGTLVVVVTPDGERSFFTDRGSSAELTPADPAWLDGARALHLPAYSLDDEPLATTARELTGMAHEHGVEVSVDCSSTAVISRLGTTGFLTLLADLRPHIVFANRDEARLLGFGPGGPAPATLCTVIHHGADPSILVAPDGNTAEVPVPPVDRVVDTTGAGDAFAAGWLVARQRGAGTTDATIEAHRLAAEVVTRPGARLGPPSR
jgi:sugar/nucleoside kinase (ribokinase family)